MKESFTYAPFVTIGVFLLGLLCTPILRRWEFWLFALKKKRLLTIELSECRGYLRSIIVDHFYLLLALENSKDEGDKVSAVPIPIVVNFDLDFLREFYKESLFVLTTNERYLARGIPERLSNLKKMSEECIDSIMSKKFYSQRIIRNIIWYASTLYCDLNNYDQKKFDKDNCLDSIEATKFSLNEFGINESEIIAANVFKSMLSDEQKYFLRSNKNFVSSE